MDRVVSSTHVCGIIVTSASAIEIFLFSNVSRNNVNYEFVTYEGYGPSGTAIIVEALTDNKNRTAANVRNAFTKGNGNVGTQE